MSHIAIDDIIWFTHWPITPSSNPCNRPSRPGADLAAKLNALQTHQEMQTRFLPSTEGDFRNGSVPIFTKNSRLVGGLEHEFYDFPYIGNNHPNWLIFFQRDRSTTNQ